MQPSSYSVFEVLVILPHQGKKLIFDLEPQTLGCRHLLSRAA